MRGPRHDVRVLAQLAALSGDELRSAWRGALANLAKASQDFATPLEGLDPDALLRSVRHVDAAGLMEEVDFLSAPAAATALYQVAAALPNCSERMRLEQNVNARLAAADAATFIALATTLVQGSQRSLSSARMRARVSVCLALPIGTQIRSEPLALALISRPDLAREWLDEPSQGGLPSRRLAARILELAARAAARRHADGDSSGVQVFETPLVREGWQRLLHDRESLVWKHVAAARGLLSEASEGLEEEIERSLAPSLSPAEWRRGAASLAARIAVAPEQSVTAARKLLSGPIAKQDPGIAAAMLLALPRAAEAEPKAAESLLVPLLRLGGVYASEALVELLAEGIGDGFGSEARGFAHSALKAQLSKGVSDDGQRALLEAVAQRLGERERPSTDTKVRRALYEFAEHGIATATPLAVQALGAAKSAVARICSTDASTAEGRRSALLSLMELEWSLLQSSALYDLLALLRDEGSGLETLEASLDELGIWLGSLDVATDEHGQLAQPTLQMRAVRSLLHLVDTEGYEGRREHNRGRRMRIVRSLLTEIGKPHPAILRRTLIVAAARGCESLVRDTTFELSDVAIAALLYLPKAVEVQAMADAAMSDELRACLQAAANLCEATTDAPDNPAGRQAVLTALEGMVRGLPAGRSPRTSGLRRALLRSLRPLRELQNAAALGELMEEGDDTALDDLIHSLQMVAQLIGGARLRIAPGSEVPVPALGHSMQDLVDAIGLAVLDRDPSLVTGPLRRMRSACEKELPPPLQRALSAALGALPTLALEATRGPAQSSRVKRATRPSQVGSQEQALPAWLPPNRTLGSFFVLHSIGEGAGGSVFVAKRSEDRNNATADLVALKVPEYDGDAARALSEADFLKMFREEAGALLAIPEDEPNLAGFVTFDAGVRPKPILVMEFVEGPSLDRLLARRHLDVEQAFDVLIGIARGLEAMHQMGIAHLDVKPSNVILRDFWSGAKLEPVLVDFGMSGRRLRPGCCTANYGAPEIWGAHDEAGDSTHDPRPADLYAFGCLAYEVLSGRRLFNADSDVALVSAHITHDGTPEAIGAMYEDLSLRPLAEWLTSCLRNKPGKRIAVGGLTKQLEAMKLDLASRRWPIRVQAKTPQAQA